MPFILSSIKRELLTPYMRSRAGGLWSLIHPLVMVLIYAFVLSEILSAKLPGIENRFAYTLYLLAGMVPWVYFSEMITRGLNLFLANAHLIKKLCFQHSALVWIYLGVCGVNHLIFLTLVLMGYIFLEAYELFSGDKIRGELIAEIVDRFPMEDVIFELPVW